MFEWMVLEQMPPGEFARWCALYKIEADETKEAQRKAKRPRSRTKGRH